MSDTNYYFGHGEAWLGVRNNSTGVVTNYDIPLPEIDSLKISIATENVTHESKRQSVASDDLDIVRKITVTGEMVVAVHSPAMLAMYLYGSVTTIAGGSFIASAAIFPSGLVVGGRYPIPGNRKNISSLVITDSTGSPVTATLGTHYNVDLAAGIITILDLTGLTQPLKAAGSEAAGSGVAGLTARQYERAMRFKGINIADNDRSYIVDFYKLQIAPASEWMLLNDGSDVNKYTVPFKVLKDTTKDPASENGQYFLAKEVTES